MPQLPPCLHCGAPVNDASDDFCCGNCAMNYEAAAVSCFNDEDYGYDETLDLESDYDPYAGDYDYGQYDEPDCPW